MDCRLQFSGDTVPPSLVAAGSMAIQLLDTSGEDLSLGGMAIGSPVTGSFLFGDAAIFYSPLLTDPNGNLAYLPFNSENWPNFILTFDNVYNLPSVSTSLGLFTESLEDSSQTVFTIAVGDADGAINWVSAQLYAGTNFGAKLQLSTFNYNCHLWLEEAEGGRAHLQVGNDVVFAHHVVSGETLLNAPHGIIVTNGGITPGATLFLRAEGGGDQLIGPQIKVSDPSPREGVYLKVRATPASMYMLVDADTHKFSFGSNLFGEDLILTSRDGLDGDVILQFRTGDTTVFIPWLAGSGGTSYVVVADDGTLSRGSPV